MWDIPPPSPLATSDTSSDVLRVYGSSTDNLVTNEQRVESTWEHKKIWVLLYKWIASRYTRSSISSLAPLAPKKCFCIIEWLRWNAFLFPFPLSLFPCKKRLRRFLLFERGEQGKYDCSFRGAEHKGRPLDPGKIALVCPSEGTIKIINKWKALRIHLNTIRTKKKKSTSASSAIETICT